jgi:hypothetical protein
MGYVFLEALGGSSCAKLMARSDENCRAVSGSPVENTTDSAGVALTSYAINIGANIDVIAAVREI